MKRRRLEVSALPGALLMALTAGTAEAGVRDVERAAVEPPQDVHPCLEVEPCLMVIEAPEPTTLEQAKEWTRQLEAIPEQVKKKPIREQIMHNILGAYRQLYAEEGASAAVDLREGFAVFEAYAATFRRTYGADTPIRADIVEAAAELLAVITKAEREENGDTLEPPAIDGPTVRDVRPPCLTPVSADRGCKRERSSATLLLLLPLAVRRRKILEKVERRLPPDVVERLKKR
jgi:hypothetical protein